MHQDFGSSTIPITAELSIRVGALAPWQMANVINDNLAVLRSLAATGLSDNQLQVVLSRLYHLYPALSRHVIELAAVDRAQLPHDLPPGTILHILGVIARHTLEAYTVGDILQNVMIAVAATMTPQEPNAPTTRAVN